MHDFSHSHEHEHQDSHNHQAPENVSGQEKRAYTMLNYLHHHNTEHTQELSQMAEQLRALGQAEAASLIEEAAALYRAGNEKLHHALHQIG